MKGVAVAAAIVFVAVVSALLAATIGVVGVVGLLAVLVIAALAARARVAVPRLPLGDAPVSGDATPPPYPSYSEIKGNLSWGLASGIYYANVTAPYLWQLMTATVTSRHGAARSRDIDWMKSRIGADLWPYIHLGSPHEKTTPQAAPIVPSGPHVRRLIDRIERI